VPSVLAVGLKTSFKYSMSLDQLQETIGYRFTNIGLLNLCLTHRSMGREGLENNNQRLEFLGDAVLGLAIAEMLYQLFPNEAEGDLSKRLVSLVNGGQLAHIATTMGLGQCLMVSSGEAEQGGRANPSNLEDACEALLGAIYLDGGIEAVRGVVNRFWRHEAQQTKSPPKDAKTTLQEWAQGRGLPLPEYVVVSAIGPSHAPNFVVDVTVAGHPPARAEAGTKRVAERLAAAILLEKLGG
jgi:ribonuclease-3